MPTPSHRIHRAIHPHPCRTPRFLPAAIVSLLAVSAGARTPLRAVPDVPGALEPKAKTAPVMVQGKPPHHANEMTDCRPDGPRFYIKSYPDPVQLWGFGQPAKPWRIWEEPGPDIYGSCAWQAGVPVGPVLLVPQLPQLRVLTVPQPSQVPPGRLAWR